jgi:hypothetical protein
MLGVAFPVLAGTQRKKNPTNAWGFGVGLETLPHKEECHGSSGEDGYRCT